MADEDQDETITRSSSDLASTLMMNDDSSEEEEGWSIATATPPKTST